MIFVRKRKGALPEQRNGVSGETTMTWGGDNDERHAWESQFRHTVSLLLGQELPTLFEALDGRSKDLNLPVTFGGARTEEWAFVCRMFRVYLEHMTLMGRKGYRAMTAGTRRSVNTRFADGLVVTEDYHGHSMDDTILAMSLADNWMRTSAAGKP